MQITIRSSVIGGIPRPEIRGTERRNPTVRSSVKPSNAQIDNLTDRTIETWQPRHDRDLSREDARQIVENATGFFSIMAEWSRAEILETEAVDRVGANRLLAVQIHGVIDDDLPPSPEAPA